MDVNPRLAPKCCTDRRNFQFLESYVQIECTLNSFRTYFKRQTYYFDQTMGWPLLFFIGSDWYAVWMDLTPLRQKSGVIYKAFHPPVLQDTLHEFCDDLGHISGRV